MTTFSVRQVQQALTRKGYLVDIDGIMGPQTERAISNFKGDNGLRRRPLIGPLTAELLFSDAPVELGREYGDSEVPPWVNEINKHMGLHEIRDNAELRAWLRSDGSTLGDPSKLPWCGDAVETAIKNTMPDEPFEGALGVNPYWARNWLYLGVPTNIAYGAVMIAERGSGGHVGFVVGHNPGTNLIRVRGGNQGNSVSDTWLDEGRVLGYRVPVTYDKKLSPIPIMNSSGAVISTNEF